MSLMCLCPPILPLSYVEISVPSICGSQSFERFLKLRLFQKYYIFKFFVIFEFTLTKYIFAIKHSSEKSTFYIINYDGFVERFVICMIFNSLNVNGREMHEKCACNHFRR